MLDRRLTMTITRVNPPGWSILDDGGTRIVRVGDDLLTAAAARLVGTGGRAEPEGAERFLAYTRAHAIPMDHFWACLDARGGVCAAVLGVPSAGRTAMLFSSRPDHLTPPQTIARVIDRTCDGLGEAGIILAQALLEPRERAERHGFTLADFEVLATLSYLERAIDRPAQQRLHLVEWPEGLTVEAYRDGLRNDFVEALDASYVETLDCPGLCGRRDTRDVLEGHQAAGHFEPDLWTLLRRHGRPAGVLMLNPSVRADSVELVYLGLAQEARRQGLGRRLLHHGLSLLAGRAERTITLAVDEANVPALRLYQHEGFRRLLRRVALVRSLHRA